MPGYTGTRPVNGDTKKGPPGDTIHASLYAFRAEVSRTTFVRQKMRKREETK